MFDCGWYKISHPIVMKPARADFNLGTKLKQIADLFRIYWKHNIYSVFQRSSNI